MFRNRYRVETPRANGVWILIETKFQFSSDIIEIYPREIPKGSPSEGCKLA
jgi:hypothetical protein